MLMINGKGKVKSVDVHKGRCSVIWVGLVAGRCVGPRILILFDKARIVTSSSLIIFLTVIAMASTDGLDQVEGMLSAWLLCPIMTDCLIEQLKAVIDNLYMLICQAHEFRGSQTTEAMTFEM
jgi:fucose permease